MSIFAIRTTVGREDNVFDMTALAIEKKGYAIKAMVLPKDVKGYIIVEAENVSIVEEAVRGINHIRGLVKKEVAFNEIQHFLIVKEASIKIGKGDSVELVSGPFKGEKAKVTRVDKTKREVTVELAEAAVPIPVTVAIESVRILEHIETAGEIEEMTPGEEAPVEEKKEVPEEPAEETPAAAGDEEEDDY